MRLSCVPVSLFGEIRTGAMPLERWISYGAELGLDGIDLSVLFFLDDRRAAVAATLRQTRASGIPVAVINTYPDFTHPEARERARQYAEFTEHLYLAAEIEARMLRITAGQAHPGTTDAENISRTLEYFLPADELAKKLKVQLVYENHAKPGVWQYPDVSLSRAVFFEVVARLRQTSIKVLYDTANPLVAGDEPLSILEPVLDRVACVHAADTQVRGALRPVLIGTGVVPFAPIFRRLRAARYDGWISIEEASGHGLEGVRQAVEFVRRSWQQAQPAAAQP